MSPSNNRLSSGNRVTYMLVTHDFDAVMTDDPKRSFQPCGPERCRIRGVYVPVAR